MLVPHHLNPPPPPPISGKGYTPRPISGIGYNWQLKKTPHFQGFRGKSSQDEKNNPFLEEKGTCMAPLCNRVGADLILLFCIHIDILILGYCFYSYMIIANIMQLQKHFLLFLIHITSMFFCFLFYILLP